MPAALTDEQANIFSAIRPGDLLVHHPYESFNASVERFINAAADDPKVLAIKMTVYRTGDESPFIRTLIRAAEAGKQVVCLVELKARFDEERNILLAHALEEAGVHVVYGVVGLKTHTKTTLVVRQDPDGIRCYAHIGTGNYHVQTARLYTDLGLFTCRSRDHRRPGRAVPLPHRPLAAARLSQAARRPGQHARAVPGDDRARDRAPRRRPAGPDHRQDERLEDRKISRALYRASQAGVPIDLIVRGFCCLRPGVPGLSENIRVISVIGRFLEHSRIFYFRNGADEPARRRVLHRLGRLDVPQPAGPGGGRRPGRGPAQPREAAGRSCRSC